MAKIISPYIYNATEQFPHTVKDWPWGRRKRCTKRFWIESNEKKGDRLWQQTTQPNGEGVCSGDWCKAKSDTYVDGVIVLALDPDGNISTETLGAWYHHAAPEIESFIDRHGDYLTEKQLNRAKLALQIRKTADNKGQDNWDKPIEIERIFRGSL